MAIIKKSAPWMTYYREVDALFKKDKDIVVVFNEESFELTLYVDDQTKASALALLMPTEKEFGSTTLKVRVIPPNDRLSEVAMKDVLTIASVAFRGNDAVYTIKGVSGILNIVYVVFKKEVVQFFDDNLGDINGNCSTLYETIAKDVFENIGISYCTADCANSITITNSGFSF